MNAKALSALAAIKSTKNAIDSITEKLNSSRPSSTKITPLYEAQKSATQEIYSEFYNLEDDGNASKSKLKKTLESKLSQLDPEAIKSRHWFSHKRSPSENQQYQAYKYGQKTLKNLKKHGNNTWAENIVKLQDAITAVDAVLPAAKPTTQPEQQPETPVAPPPPTAAAEEKVSRPLPRTARGVPHFLDMECMNLLHEINFNYHAHPIPTLILEENQYYQIHEQIKSFAKAVDKLDQFKTKLENENDDPKCKTAMTNFLNIGFSTPTTARKICEDCAEDFDTMDQIGENLRLGLIFRQKALNNNLSDLISQANAFLQSLETSALKPSKLQEIKSRLDDTVESLRENLDKTSSVTEYFNNKIKGISSKINGYAASLQNDLITEYPESAEDIHRAKHDLQALADLHCKLFEKHHDEFKQALVAEPIQAKEPPARPKTKAPERTNSDANKPLRRPSQPRPALTTNTFRSPLDDSVNHQSTPLAASQTPDNNTAPAYAKP